MNNLFVHNVRKQFSSMLFQPGRYFLSILIILVPFGCYWLTKGVVTLTVVLKPIQVN